MRQLSRARAWTPLTWREDGAARGKPTLKPNLPSASYIPTATAEEGPGLGVLVTRPGAPGVRDLDSPSLGRGRPLPLAVGRSWLRGAPAMVLDDALGVGGGS